jgi:hypothetical protein
VDLVDDWKVYLKVLVVDGAIDYYRKLMSFLDLNDACS